MPLLISTFISLIKKLYSLRSEPEFCQPPKSPFAWLTSSPALIRGTYSQRSGLEFYQPPKSPFAQCAALAFANKGDLLATLKPEIYQPPNPLRSIHYVHYANKGALLATLVIHLSPYHLFPFPFPLSPKKIKSTYYDGTTTQRQQ